MFISGNEKEEEPVRKTSESRVEQILVSVDYCLETELS